MWRVLLVDDDMVVRVGIKTIGNWAKYDMEIVGEASGGCQALTLFKELRPDLVITDIRMPGMDGIELLGQIRSLSQDARVVMLSNYDDKEYLKDALRRGANNFVTKNELDENTLADVLRREWEALEATRKARPAEKESAGVTPAVKNHFLTKYLAGGYGPETLVGRFCQYILEGDRSAPFCACLMLLDYRFDQGRQAEGLALQENYMANLVQGVLTKYPRSVVVQNERLSRVAALLIAPSLTGGEVEYVCQCAMDASALYAKARVHIGSSDVARDAGELRAILGQAECAVLCASLDEGNRIEPYRAAQGAPDVAAQRRFTNLLRQLYVTRPDDGRSMRSVCAQLIGELREHPHTLMKKLYCNELVAWYRRVAAQLSQGAPPVEELDITLLLSSFDLEELQELSLYYVFRLESARQEEEASGNPYVESVKEYLSANYKNPVSLSDAARHVHLSKNYLSALFSEVTGVSLVEYLTRLRIRAAVELMNAGSMQVQEVARLSGFQSERYFSQTFKNLLGVSPSMYCRIVKS
jgi:two-component system response regulator YesN